MHQVRPEIFGTPKEKNVQERRVILCAERFNPLAPTVESKTEVFVARRCGITLRFFPHSVSRGESEPAYNRVYVEFALEQPLVSSFPFDFIKFLGDPFC